MARVTVLEVKTILGNTSLSDDAVTAFIDMAHFIVDDKIVGSGYSEQKLKLIELNLSAHFTTAQNPQITSRKIGDVQDSYKVSDLNGLESTLYGQTALMLDNMNFLPINDASVIAFEVY
jgi:hypothetical protein